MKIKSLILYSCLAFFLICGCPAYFNEAYFKVENKSGKNLILDTNGPLTYLADGEIDEWTITFYGLDKKITVFAVEDGRRAATQKSFYLSANTSYSWTISPEDF